LEYASKPAFYESWAQFGPLYSQTDLLATLASVSNLNLTAFYHPFVIIVDGGWAAPTRDGEGKLQFDPVKFPGGTNIVNIIHDYGCKALLWLESAGPGLTPSTGTPSTWGTNVEFDAQTLARWGCDGAKFDLIVDNTTGAQKIDQVTRFVTAFRSVTTNRQTYFYHDVGPAMDRDQFSDFPPGCVICENSENDPGDILPWTATMMTHLWNVNGKSHWNCGREVYEGWVPPHPKPYNASFLKIWSMLGSPYVFTAVTGAENGPGFRDIYSRRECIALNNDSLYAAPALLFQTLTNLGLSRRRSDGTITALVFNMTTDQTQDFTLLFSQLGLPEGQPADVRDIYYETNCGTFSNSFSFNLGPMQTVLLTFDSEGRPPVLDIAQPNPGDLLISVQGRSNQEIVLQNSTNLQNWFPLATNTLGSDPWIYQDELGKWGPRQYFRGVRP
jgi:alpha-galactosidase